MVRAGWGAVYEKAGAEYGQWSKDAYLAAQSEAQYAVTFFFVFLERTDWLRNRAARRGIWQGGTDIELPAEYKKRYRTVEQARIGEAELETFEPDSGPKGFLSRIFRRSERGRGKA
jgi:hypothetical protein